MKLNSLFYFVFLEIEIKIYLYSCSDIYSNETSKKSFSFLRFG